ncbi:hypothetical protein Clacol_006790 [Clathrus columnatus]|uniref:Coiled-coil domain-containing protein 12 n=1 Tax=Clathrus columnatus TaxID=1419009 RepID=A0AAV5AFN6_9AGAM|nr:hypothetical protein Clacol_006790 [Clathrus columnatus]
MASLEEEAKARKERLLTLRRRKAGEEGNEEGILIKQRNFDPETRALRKFDPSIIPQDTVENNVKGEAERILAEDEERQQQELDLLNIAPKRANWDLKREMEKKLARLERKTTESIHTLIRQRIMAQKGSEGDLVAALNAHQKDQEIEEISDEE